MAGTPSLVLNFADSEVRRVTQIDLCIHIDFSAASARQTAADGVVVDGFLTGASLVLHGAAATPAFLLAFGRVRAGALRGADAAARPLQSLPVPGKWAGACVLELDFSQGPLLSLPLQQLECRVEAGWSFRESLFC